MRMYDLCWRVMETTDLRQSWYHEIVGFYNINQNMFVHISWVLCLHCKHCLYKYNLVDNVYIYTTHQTPSRPDVPILTQTLL